MMHAPGALILAQWWRLLPFSVAVPALSLGTILNGYIARRAVLAMIRDSVCQRFALMSRYARLICKAQNLNSGIFAVGSSAAWVNRLAAASW
jgi:hypothetical protein